MYETVIKNYYWDVHCNLYLSIYLSLMGWLALMFHKGGVCYMRKASDIFWSQSSFGTTIVTEEYKYTR